VRSSKFELTRAQQRAIAVFIEDSRRLLVEVASIIDARLNILGQRRVTSTEVALALSGTIGLRRWSDENMLWRTRTIISTAFHAGAYQSFGFELRPGVGFRLKTDVLPTRKNTTKEKTRTKELQQQVRKKFKKYRETHPAV
jgi:hypothetical protein